MVPLGAMHATRACMEPCMFGPSMRCSRTRVHPGLSVQPGVSVDRLTVVAPSQVLSAVKVMGALLAVHMQLEGLALTVSVYLTFQGYVGTSAGV